MRIRTLKAEMWLALPVEQVFMFFSDPSNLGALTPPRMQFSTLTPKPIILQAGTILDHQLRIHGMPLRWRSEITVWQPPHQFVDEQRRGPYKFWRHRHDFEAHEGGTWIRDHIDYAVRGWLLEPLIHRWIVAPDLRAIFAFRQQKIRELLLPHSSAPEGKIEFC